MSICLMPHVPYDAVGRRVERVQQGHGELDDAESRPDVSPGLRDHLDQSLPDLVGQRCELRARETADIFRTGDAIENGHAHLERVTT